MVLCQGMPRFELHPLQSAHPSCGLGPTLHAPSTIEPAAAQANDCVVGYSMVVQLGVLANWFWQP